MKISLSWIFDYIDASLASVDVKQLVHLFNTHTAEIEHFEQSVIALQNMFVVQVDQIAAGKVAVVCKELNRNIELSMRTDAIVGKYYLIKRIQETYSWVSLADFGSLKEGLLCAIFVEDKALDGSWRKAILGVDYILDVDNKSINHRPDLWGHYGIAREIAAILNLKLKPLEDVLYKQPILNFEQKSQKSSRASYEIAIEDTAGCSRFAGLFCDQIQYKDSDLALAIRLIRVGGKPINAMVDLTNYVMFDIGHPMHVFDAQAFQGRNVVIRKARAGETLTVLDGAHLKLTESDMVIANDSNPVALAGIMGGKDSGFSLKTQSILLEAAGFHPSTIRITAQHFKVRTEASARFEKHLDPMQNITALQRFLYLAINMGVVIGVTESIVSVGAIVEPAPFIITHNFIEKHVGTSISTAFIVETLQKLGFGITVQHVDQTTQYHVVIPTYRMTKDVRIGQDILEEIVRMYGYDNIMYKPVMRPAEPFDTHEIRNVSDIKKHLAYACNMHEVRDYLFFDESFIKRLAFNPSHAITVRNPGSENWMRLVTSLVPHLIKNVELNMVKKDHVRFFEWNRIWPKGTQEKTSLAGIVFDKKSINFYDIKAELQTLWNQLGLSVSWVKPIDTLAPWYDTYKTAELFVGEQSIGFAGMASLQFLKPIVDGQAFIFELDADFLSALKDSQKLFHAWSKYQDVTYDISLMVPLTHTASEIIETIRHACPKIISVALIDFFEKEEWVDKRALTLRYVMSDASKTLDKQEIDAIVALVEKSLQKYNVVIR